MTLGVARSMLNTGASVAKDMSVAPESTMPVAFVRSSRWRRVWVQSDGTLLMSGKGEGVVSRVVLNLSV